MGMGLYAGGQKKGARERRCACVFAASQRSWREGRGHVLCWRRALCYSKQYLQDAFVCFFEVQAAVLRAVIIRFTKSTT